MQIPQTRRAFLADATLAAAATSASFAWPGLARARQTPYSNSASSATRYPPTSITPAPSPRRTSAYSGWKFVPSGERTLPTSTPTSFLARTGHSGQIQPARHRHRNPALQGRLAGCATLQVQYTTRLLCRRPPTSRNRMMSSLLASPSQSNSGQNNSLLRLLASRRRLAFSVPPSTTGCVPRPKLRANRTSNSSWKMSSNATPSPRPKLRVCSPPCLRWG